MILSTAMDVVAVLSEATPVPAAPVANENSSDLSFWLAPGGGLAAFAAAMLAAARMFRDGRREDVKGARAKELEAEARAEAAEKERDTLVEEVRKQLQDVRRELRERDRDNDRNLREMSERHAAELAAMQREHLEQIRTIQHKHDLERQADQERLVNLVADNFRMQELLAGKGWEPQTGRLQSMVAARQAIQNALESGAVTGEQDGSMGP